MKDCKIKLPCNFDSNNPEFNIFRQYHESLHEINAEVKKFENVRVANNGALFNYFNIVDRSNTSDRTYKNKYKIFLRLLPKIHCHKNKRFVLVFDQWTFNYFHWLLTAVYRLLILRQNNLLQDSIIILPAKYKKFDYVSQTLKELDIGAEQILYLNRISNIKVKQLFTVKIYNNFNYVKEIREFLASNIKSTVNMGDKIYISRQKCVYRNIKNEEEVLKLVTRYGFKKVIMEDYSYQEQKSIASNAKYIIGSHGAGLTNVLFMKDGSSLLELATKPSLASCYHRNSPTDYCKMLNTVDINYFYQDCDSNPENNHNRFHGCLTVDVVKLEENLKLMLKS